MTPSNEQGLGEAVAVLEHFIRAYHANDKQWLEAAYKRARGFLSGRVTIAPQGSVGTSSETSKPQSHAQPESVAHDELNCLFCGKPAGADVVMDKNGEIACRVCGEAEMSAQRDETIGEALRHAGIDLSILLSLEGKIPSDVKDEIRKTLKLLDRVGELVAHGTESSKSLNVSQSDSPGPVVNRQTGERV